MKNIKPCIKKNQFVPFRLYDVDRFNAFCCDEISGSTSKDFKFMICQNGAELVISDIISTMNFNPIYELGARHALKPRSTILIFGRLYACNFVISNATKKPYDAKRMS